MSSPSQVYVCIIYSGRTQRYTRDVEEKRGGRWTAVPYFTADSTATKMTEQAGIALVKRLRLLREDPWLESVATGERIDVPSDSPSFAEDTREVMRATLDDDAAVANGTAQWYVVKPANTPGGAKWYVKAVVPGRPEPDVIYSDTILGALQRAADIGFLCFCERNTPPERPKQQQPVASNGPKIRPGDRY
jgi:hypothetical protein